GHALESDRLADLAAAERAMLAVLSMPGLPSIPASFIHVSTAMMRARMGELELVRQRLGLVLLDDPWVVSVVQVAGMMAEPVALAGDADMAAKLYQRLERWAGVLVSYGRSGMSCGGPTDLALGIL